MRLSSGAEPEPVSEAPGPTSTRAGPLTVIALLTASRRAPVRVSAPCWRRVKVCVTTTLPSRPMKARGVPLVSVPFTSSTSLPKLSALLVARRRSAERLVTTGGAT